MSSTHRPTEGTDPALIALDWGTSSLRAFLMNAAGQVLAERSSGHGIRALPEPGPAGFERALQALTADWSVGPGRGALPLVAGGMVGSAQGWREAPYLDCPADVTALAQHALPIPLADGRVLRVAPGLRHLPPEAPPDVMRGEEIQIAGALALQPELARDACIVLPGTHSKWVRVQGRRITAFRTFMTGELYAVLKAHSILGQLMPDEAPGRGDDKDEGESTAAAAAAEHEAAFRQGLALARRSGPGELGHQLFAVRTLGLTGRMPHGLLADVLSGLLIGHELVAGLAWRASWSGPAADAPPLLIGAPSLTARYAAALGACGAPQAVALGNTAPQGLHAFAVRAGLLGGADPSTENLA